MLSKTRTLLEERTRPSSMGRVMKCPGSVLYGGTSSGSAAIEGSAAHELAAICFRTGEDPADYLDKTVPVETGTDAGTVEHPVDEEMVQCVREYIGRVKKAAGLEKIYVEYGLPSGTLDAGIIHDNGVIEIHDLKFGYTPVEAYRNPQLTIYAAELTTKADGPVESYRIVIHQPRLRGVPDVWECTRAEMWDAYSEIQECRTQAGVILSQESAAPEQFRAGSHCKYCAGQADCPAHRALVTSDFEVLEPETPEKMQAALGKLTPDEVGDYLTKAEAISAVLNELKARARGLLEQGVDVPGWKLVTGKRGPRKWADAAEAERRAKKTHRLRDDVMYKKVFLSPTQFEKAAGDKYPKYVDLITQEDGKPCLVPSSDKRAGITIACADDFEVLDGPAPAQDAGTPEEISAEDLF